MEWVHVESSLIEKVSYDPKNEDLWVEFKNGERYHYFEVPYPVYRHLIDAESVGKFFHKEIRGKDYHWEKGEKEHKHE